MICKWCGETLKPGAKTCKRCHREIPPLSDCGGFYDLVPQAGGVAAVPAEEIPIHTLEETNAQPEAMEPPVRPVLPKKRKKKNNTIINLVFWVSIGLVVILLIQTISLSGKLSDAKAEIQRLRDKNSTSQETQATNAPNGKDPKPTNPEEPEIPSESDHDEDPGLLTEDCLNGEATVVFDDDTNDHLRSDPVTVSLWDDTDEVIVILTLELSGSEDSREMRLELADNRVGWQIHGIQWHNADGKEIKARNIPAEGFTFQTEDDEDEEQENQPEYVGSVLPLENDEKMKLTCTISGVDSEGDEVLVILRGIVIE